METKNDKVKKIVGVNQKDGKKTLNPQAAEYYKRLLLVSDRHYLLIKRYSRLRIYSWFITMALIVSLLAWIKPLVSLVRTWLENAIF